MQAQNIDIKTGPYTDGMKTGRPAKSERTAFGEHIHSLREAAGLSQQQVADALGISQPAYALWERRDVAVRIDQLRKLSDVLGTPVDGLVNFAAETKRRGGPQGRARQTFEDVSKLPRSRQKKILDVVDALIKA
jgi:transcriptional regulator with XRE-family HTH domain